MTDPDLTLALAEAPECPVVLPDILGYALERELGRGGMGVVYAARHLALDRPVALKLVLAGTLAGHAEAARFRVEAEALARVAHPGVVQIFEVGSHAGVPFLALEFCPGGSLADRLEAGPMTPGEAARVASALARAAHAAHQRGVIHRDLKPANVLLAADGTPKLTDFGLAKRTDSDAGLTQSGAILGTPVYMAPEQADGASDAATTAADVYALGVILFECLTGQVPFRGATPVDTLVRVVNDAPPRPSDVRPGVPRDLEAVALKCLAKLPAERYASAAALADDLDRWAAGEPVSARPPGLVGVLRAWARQNFGAFGWTAVIGVGLGLTCGLAVWLTMVNPHLVRNSAALAPAGTVVSSLAPDWLTSRWVRALMSVPGAAFVGLVGLLTARLVGTRTREADIAAGLVTGLFAATAFFVSGFGWAMTNVAALQTGASRDIYLVSWAWSAHGAEGGAKAETWLLERHPELAGLSQGRRANALHARVVADILTGVPIGMWAGMAGALLILVPFAVLSTAWAGRLLRAGRRGWGLIWRYLEFAVPLFLATSNLAVIPVSFAAGGGLYGSWAFNALVVLPAVGAVAVARGWSRPLRVILFAAWAAWGFLRATS